MSLAERCALFTGKSATETRDFPAYGIDSLRMTDGPSGVRADLAEGAGSRSLCYPSACLLACSFDRDAARRTGQLLGRDGRARGVDLLLGPAVNLKRSPLCGRNFEYYSEDPCLTGEMAAAFVEGVQESTGACAKHFAANNRENKRMSVDCVVDKRTLRETYLSSFRRIVKKSPPDAVMTAYNRINGEFAGENAYTLEQVLRGDWAYDGLVVSDWGAVDDVVASVRRGMDLEMPGNSSAARKLERAVKRGDMTEERLTERAAEALRRADAVRARRCKADFDGEEALKALADIAAESAVLLKNEGELLPLRGAKRIGIFGELAVKPRIQGGGCANVATYETANIERAVRERFADCECVFSLGYAEGAEDGEALVREALETARTCDACVVAMGLPESYESEGYDRTDIEIPPEQTAFLRRLGEVNPRVAVLLYGGSMISLDFERYARAVVMCYLGGSATGLAAAKILSGDTPPAGRLAETFLYRKEDASCHPFSSPDSDVEVYGEGLFVGYKYYGAKGTAVRYPFGYGLNYGRAEYEDAEISEDSVRLTLVGDPRYDVRETVQIYVGFPDCGYARPIAELKEFRKVTVPRGERVTVEIPLGRDCFETYDAAADAMTVRGGRAVIGVRRNALEVVAEKTVVLEGEKGARYDRNTLIGELLKTRAGIRVIEEKLKGHLIRAILGNFRADILPMKDGRAIGHDRFNSIMESMPLRALVNLTGGAFSEEEMEEIVDGLREGE